MISASPRRLSVFKSVVDLGGFNAAASQLGIAQPSVGAHIRALEDQIGQPLFQRHRGARPRLTRAGEALYTYAVDTLRRSEEAAHALDRLRKNDAARVTIAVHRDLSSDFLPPRLALFSRRHPEARFVTRIGIIEEVVALVRRREVDIAIFLGSGPVEGLRSEVLAHEPLVLVASRDHPLAAERSISSEKVSRFQFVAGLRGSRYYDLADAALRSAGIDAHDVAIELQESAAVKEIVRHGAGVACLPLCTVRPEVEAGSIAVLDLAAALPRLEIRCGYRAPLAGIARQFLAAIKKRPE